MDLMLVEPYATGHRMILYVRSIALEALSRGWRLRLLTTASARTHPGYRAVSEGMGRAMEIHEMPEVKYPERRPSLAQLVRFQWEMYSAVAAGYRGACNASGTPDVVYLNSLDQFDRALALRQSPFDVPFAGMIMAPRFHHRGEGVNTPARWIDPVNRILFRRLLRVPELGAVTFVDPSLSAGAERGEWSEREKLRWVPEPAALTGIAEDRAQCRTRFGIREEAFVILLYGGITERKGLSRLLAALNDPSIPTSVVALVAGRPDSAAAAMLSADPAARLRARQQLIEVPGFLDDHEESSVFRAADAVWLGYEGFYGPSGVLVQAAAAGLPVIASSEGLIAWLVHRHGLGVLLEGGEAGAAKAIGRLLSDSALRKACAAQARDFGAQRTPQRFGSAVCDVLADMRRKWRFT